MKRILITGISGFIGQYLYKYSPADVKITGTYFYNRPDLKEVDLVFLDLSNVDDIIKKSEKYNVIIHCAANANLQSCEESEKNAYLVNTLATEKLAKWSLKQGSKFIYLSTDIVFDGSKGDYLESDMPNPINVYGKTKAAAEHAIIKYHHNYIVLRLALCIGKGLKNTTSFIDWFFKKLECEEEIPLYFDEIRTPVSAKFIAHTIWELVNKEYVGILHLAGKTKINRYNLGLEILKYLNLNKSHLLKKTSSSNAIYPRPKDVSMKSNKLNNIIKTPQEKITNLIENIL